MDLSPREKDKLLIFTAALVAERRRDRGEEAYIHLDKKLDQVLII